MINRRLPSTLLAKDKAEPSTLFRVRLSAFLADPQGRYLILQYEDAIAQHASGEWIFPNCPIDVAEDPHKTITHYLESLTHASVKVDTLAVPSQHWSKFRIYFHALLDTMPGDMHLPPHCRTHAWVRPDEFDSKSISQPNIDKEARQFIETTCTDLCPRAQ